MSEIGITLSFRHDCIHIRKETIAALGEPEYIHLRINNEEKQIFIQSCEKDNDAFRVSYYVVDGKTDSGKYCIFAKKLLTYLALVIGVEYPSNSLWFSGQLLDDKKTVFVDLSTYRVIERDKRE